VLQADELRNQGMHGTLACTALLLHCVLVLVLFLTASAPSPPSPPSGSRVPTLCAAVESAAEAERRWPLWLSTLFSPWFALGRAPAPNEPNGPPATKGALRLSPTPFRLPLIVDKVSLPPPTIMQEQPRDLHHGGQSRSH
jgi:hypothetical protein